MTALRDSRILAGLLAVLVAPAFACTLLFPDALEDAYAAFDSELGTRTLLLVNDTTPLVLGIAVIVLYVLTFRSFGSVRASDDAVAVVRTAVFAALVGASIVLAIAFEPLIALFDKIA